MERQAEERLVKPLFGLQFADVTTTRRFAAKREAIKDLWPLSGEALTSGNQLAARTMSTARYRETAEILSGNVSHTEKLAP